MAGKPALAPFILAAIPGTSARPLPKFLWIRSRSPPATARRTTTSADHRRFAEMRLAMLVRPLALFLALTGTLAAQETEPPKKLGILVFPGVQVIDFTGPYEVLKGAHSGGRLLFDVVTVGVSDDEFRAGQSDSGIRMLADFSLDDCPKLDILVIPGGGIGPISDDKAIEWVKKVAQDAECVMSVCNGAFVLAKAGLLENQTATTYHGFIDGLAEAEPTCTVVYDQRFVDNGKIITTAGLSSGIDGALHLIERYGSRFDAEQKALALEYHWQPELNWSRANLADRHLVKMLGDAGFAFPDGRVSAWRTVENNGTMEQWTRRWTFDSALTKDEIVRVFEEKFAAAWKPAGGAGDNATWGFEDEQGGAWKAALMLTSLEQGRWSAAVRLGRSAAQ